MDVSHMLRHLRRVVRVERWQRPRASRASRKSSPHARLQVGYLPHVVADLRRWQVLKLRQLEQLAEVSNCVLIVLELLVRLAPVAVSLDQYLGKRLAALYPLLDLLFGEVSLPNRTFL